MISHFWLTGAKLTMLDEWAAKDAEIRRAYWQHKTPEEHIAMECWDELPARRRKAIEQHVYQAAA